ncbi:MAG TPA: class I SAM-dependent methyltransferase [Chloroflexota bacterium]|nr:class I SAM-dependent methyltransferase [Chloroflexota bacterium]
MLSLTIPRDAAPTLRDHVEQLLVCPRCRSWFTVVGNEVRCQDAACGFVGLLTHDVVVLGDQSAPSFFDDRHAMMTAGNAQEGVRCLCYDHQAQVVEPLLKPGAIVLDVGCGPTLPYTKPADTFVIGLEASYPSIKANRAVDMRLYGSALEIPLPDGAVDAVLAYYAVHHMTGRTVAENRHKLELAFRELGRVVKPGGELLVFEVSPWRPFWIAEKLFWNTAKSVLGDKLDMCFYPADVYEQVGRKAMPHARFSVQSFSTSLLSTFPPAFSLPWLPIPRYLYPFDVALYHWRVSATATGKLAH